MVGDSADLAESLGEGSRKLSFCFLFLVLLSGGQLGTGPFTNKLVQMPWYFVSHLASFLEFISPLVWNPEERSCKQ